MSSAKLVVIGLDSADKELVRRWAADGSLPNFARLFDDGRYREMVAPPGHCAGTIWPSINTGVSPAGHGCYFSMQLRPGTYSYTRVLPHDYEAAPFWERLSAAGKRVAIIDVPKAPVSAGINGWQIVDWGNHDPEYHPARSVPEALIQDIEARFGNDPVGSCDRTSRRAVGARESAALRDRLVQRVGTKLRIIQHVLANGPWDLVMAVFAEPHCAGHQFWRVSDTAHAQHDPELARLLGDPLREVYSALDGAIGKLLAELEPDTDVMVFSDLGMGPNYTGTYLLRDIVRKLHAHARGRRSRHIDSLHWLWRKLPRSARLRGRSVLSPIKPDIDLETRDRDYFVVRSNEDCGAIRVNLEGREPEGGVHAGREYDELCDSISADLLEIVNVESGEPLVSDVLRTDGLFDGPRRQDLPDLNIVWNRTAPIRKIRSPKIGLIERDHESVRSGDHRPTGFVLTRGGGGESLPPISATDLAPAICAMLGVALGSLAPAETPRQRC